MGKKLLLVWILLTNILLAKDYALIIGIWDYSSAEKFSNINREIVMNDISIYKRILSDWKIGDVTTIENGTKNKIIDELEKISKKKDIDSFYMFFTGHGLSYKNKHYENMKTLKSILKNSGAIVPFGHKKDEPDTLIIGCRDLKPLLIEIDKKAKKGLIMFDACYSEKSSRDNTTKKRINLSKTTLCSDKDKGYPYKKLVYISSSSLKAELGTVSKGLKRCLSKENDKNKDHTLSKNAIEECINQNPALKAQRASVFPHSGDLSVF